MKTYVPTGDKDWGAVSTGGNTHVRTWIKKLKKTNGKRKGRRGGIKSVVQEGFPGNSRLKRRGEAAYTKECSDR